MHVLSIVANGVAGDSRVIKSAQVSASMGYHSTLVGTSAQPNPPMPEVPGVDVIVLPNPPRPGCSGITALPQYQTRFDRTIRNLSEGAFDVAKKRRPSIVHSHDVLGLIAGGFVVESLRQIDSDVMWIHDVHEDALGLDFTPSETHLLAEAEHYFLPRVDAVTTVSYALADRIRDRYQGAIEADVVFSAPSMLFNKNVSRPKSIRQSIGVGDENFLLVYVGNVKPARGVDNALKAIAGIQGVHFAVVSNSSAGAEELNDLARILGVTDRFHTVPYVEHHQVPAFVEGADAGFHGLLPSPNAEVAMPNKMWEYLMAGIPVLFPDFGTMGEFVRRFELGETYESNNVASLVEAIGRLRHSMKTYNDAVKAFDLTDYSWETQSERISTLYRELLARSGRRSVHRARLKD